MRSVSVKEGWLCTSDSKSAYHFGHSDVLPLKVGSVRRGKLAANVGTGVKHRCSGTERFKDTR